MVLSQSQALQADCDLPPCSSTVAHLFPHQWETYTSLGQTGYIEGKVISLIQNFSLSFRTCFGTLTTINLDRDCHKFTLSTFSPPSKPQIFKKSIWGLQDMEYTKLTLSDFESNLASLADPVGPGDMQQSVCSSFSQKGRSTAGLSGVLWDFHSHETWVQPAAASLCHHPALFLVSLKSNFNNYSVEDTQRLLLSPLQQQ